MSTNNQPPSDHGGSLPKDDSGINNDHILDLCDFIIDSAWTKYLGNSDYVKEGSSGTPSIKELQDLSATIQNVWVLVQEILNLDHDIRNIAKEGDDDDDSPHEDTSQEPDDEP